MNEVIKYLYIDDSIEEATQSAKGFNTEKLNVETKQCDALWKEQMLSITNEKNIDGLILDLRLDDTPNNEGNRSDFRGSAIAQEIRSRQTEGKIKQFPIILFSANNKINQSFNILGNNIFDIIIDKSSINDVLYKQYQNQLYSIAKAYEQIQKSKDNKNPIIKLLNIKPDLIDDRFVCALENIEKKQCNVLVNFFLKELIIPQGLLVDENILAARLGVDRKISLDWYKVLEYFKEAQYEGILSEGWGRWWMVLLEKKWTEISPNNPYLQMLNADERVDILKEKLNIERLFPAKIMEKAHSSQFWEICQAYEKPIDPIDGFIIAGQNNLSPWLEPLYVSNEGALKKYNHNKWVDVESFEKARLEDLKKQYSK